MWILHKKQIELMDGINSVPMKETPINLFVCDALVFKLFKFFSNLGNQF